MFCQERIRRNSIRFVRISLPTSPLKGALEEILAEKIVADTWRLRRVPQLEAALHKSRLSNGGRGGLEPDRLSHSDRVAQDVAETFTNLWRYEIALSRSFSRTLHELQRLQAIRAGERSRHRPRWTSTST